MAWSPEEVEDEYAEKFEGEYAEKFQHRLKEMHAGTLITIAMQHGYGRDPGSAKDTDTHAESKGTASLPTIPPYSFPLPAGGISCTQSAQISFPVIASTHRLRKTGAGALSFA